MSNGLKFRHPQQQANASWQKFGTSEETETPFGAKQEWELEKAEREKLDKIVGTRQKQRETPGKSGTTTRKGPPGQRNRQTGGGEEDEFDRLVAMIENIRKTLELLVNMKRPVLPTELNSSIRQSWPRADESLKSAITTLRNKNKRAQLRPQLEKVGFTGDMLDMKETSVNFHMTRVGKAILTYDQNESKLEKFVRWIKPGFKVMNSILGSLSAIPGVEVGKEFKEHVESAYEVVETGQVE